MRSKQAKVPTLINFSESDRLMLDAIVEATNTSMTDILRQLVAKKYATLRKWGKINEDAIASRV